MTEFGVSGSPETRIGGSNDATAWPPSKSQVGMIEIYKVVNNVLDPSEAKKPFE